MKQRRMGVFKVKTHLSELLKQVEAGEEILITKRGEPIAKLVPCKTGKGDIDSLIEDFFEWRKNITWRMGTPIEEAKSWGRK